MPYYDYLCRSCGYATNDELFLRVGEAHPGACPMCHGVLVRAVCRVSISRGMDWGGTFQPHFNQTVGQPVTSLRDFHAKLAAKARENTEATGIEHTYVTTDPRDRDTHGITDEALEINEAVNRGERVDGDGQYRQTEPKLPPVEVGEAPPLIGEKT
jgi:hypothetical protein